VIDKKNDIKVIPSPKIKENSGIDFAVYISFWGVVNYN